VSAPLVAVLCAPPRAGAAAAGVALALARAVGASCALASALGDDSCRTMTGAPAAARTAAALRRRDLPADASGRLVRLRDRRGPIAADPAVAGRAAALAADLRRAAAATGMPAALALPVARSAALDRVLAWHDAVVVVQEADAIDGMGEQTLASVRALGRPVAAMAPPPRLAAALALAGLSAPPQATAAVAELRLGAAGRADG